MKTILKTDITVEDICEGFVYNELEGKVAIITGSARNIGKRIAIELAKAGAARV